MNRNELKKVLKPLIKQCIKEVIFEEGALSSVITEVLKNTQSIKQPPVLQKPQNDFNSETEQQELLQERWKQEQERKRKLLDATGFSGVDVFEGTKPLSTGGSLNEGASSAQGALTGVDPEDAGVDISGIMAIGGQRWKKLAKRK